MSVAAVLLAAGLSRRFGAADKIAAPLHGIPLGHHAAGGLLRLGLDANYVVTSGGALDWPGFTVVRNDTPEAGLGRSVALGVAAARAGGASAVLIALADMPFVPADHFARLVERHRSMDSLVASADGARRMPPALFGVAWFGALEALEGERGAARLLDRADLVHLPPDGVTDIDRPEDLALAAERRSPRQSASERFGSPPVADPPSIDRR